MASAYPTTLYNPRRARDTPSPPRSYAPQYPSAPAAYSFHWAVQDDYSHNNYGHQENRNDKLTTGEYYVNLPDGRRQKVTYTVDGYGGYVAEVSYEGEAQYPPENQYNKPAPSYPKPAPSYPKPAPPPSYPKPTPTPAPAPTYTTAAPAPSYTPYQYVNCTRPFVYTSPLANTIKRAHIFLSLTFYLSRQPQPSVRRYSYRPAPSSEPESKEAPVADPSPVVPRVEVEEEAPVADDVDVRTGPVAPEGRTYYQPAVVHDEEEPAEEEPTGIRSDEQQPAEEEAVVVAEARSAPAENYQEGEKTAEAKIDEEGNPVESPAPYQIYYKYYY